MEQNKIFRHIVSGTAMLTAILLLIDSLLDGIQDWIGYFWIVLDILFTIEFAVRCYARPEFRSIFTDFWIWIDFLSLIPFWVSVFQGTMPWPEPISFEGFLILRLLKAIRHYSGTVIISDAISHSMKALYIPLYFFGLLAVICGTAVYYAERDEPGTVFTSIPRCFWFSFVTMTTVGYGDMFPTSFSGQMIAIFCMFSGIVSLAMALTIVGNAFALSWERKNQLFLLTDLRRIIEGNGDKDPNRYYKLFAELDADGSGFLDFQEFTELLDRLSGGKKKKQMTRKEAKQLFNFFDDTREGQISFLEFFKPIFPKQNLTNHSYSAWRKKEGLLEGDVGSDAEEEIDEDLAASVIPLMAKLNRLVKLVDKLSQDNKMLRDQNAEMKVTAELINKKLSAPSQ